MKIALWRYGLPLQTDIESAVGGGTITSFVIKYLAELGDVFVVDQATKATACSLKRPGSGITAYIPSIPSIQDFDLAFIITGPSNAMFPGYERTYQLLSTYSGKAVYAQWDVALPFMFQPSPIKGKALPDPMLNKDWVLMTQVDERLVRASKSKSSGYGEVNYTHCQCFFELVELERHRQEVHLDPIPKVAYFGSDRPGRMKELTRWFKGTGIPVDIYGQWSRRSRVQLRAPNITFKGRVREDAVASLLNKYLCTLYMTDPAYAKNDFVAERFFENGRAGLPVLYSNFIQPSVKTTLEATGCSDLIVVSTVEFKEQFDGLLKLSSDARMAAVQRHWNMITNITRFKQGITLKEAIRNLK